MGSRRNRQVFLKKSCTQPAQPSARLCGFAPLSWVEAAFRRHSTRVLPFDMHSLTAVSSLSHFLARCFRGERTRSPRDPAQHGSEPRDPGALPTHRNFVVTVTTPLVDAPLRAMNVVRFVCWILSKSPFRRPLVETGCAPGLSSRKHRARRRTHQRRTDEFGANRQSAAAGGTRSTPDPNAATPGPYLAVAARVRLGAARRGRP